MKIKFLSDTFKAIVDKEKRKSAYKKRLSDVGLSWVYIKYLKHIKPGKIRYHKLNGKQLTFTKGPELLHALQEIYGHQIYLQELPQNAKIIDCGANIGISVIYLKSLFPDAHITAFEPDTSNFPLLEKNVASFGLQNVTLRKEAVWIRNESLFFENNGSQDSRIVEGIEQNNAIEVKGIRLKDEINSKIDFLKIDIEGAEYEVIKDISDKLSFVDHLFIEYHGKFDQGSNLVDILNIVTTNGFSFYIKEAASVYETPFLIARKSALYDVQLNIFCVKNK